MVPGHEIAGVVAEVGPSVTDVKVGDRVVGHAVATDSHSNRSAEGAFQHFVVLRTNMTAHLPEALSFQEAAVIPLGFSTAACGLFEKDKLALRYPSASAPKPTGKTLLVWGGSTSVGCNAIQLAVAAGYEVVTTCSPRNFDLVRGLGASQAFDYNSSTVVEDIVAAMAGKDSAGALAIGQGANGLCLDIVNRCKGDKVMIIATGPLPDPLPERFFTLGIVSHMVPRMAAIMVKAKLRGIRTAFIFGSSLAFNEVGKAVYNDFLPAALAAGTFVAAPDPLVVGSGLDKIQEALEVQKRGVSAKKVVVLL